MQTQIWESSAGRVSFEGLHYRPQAHLQDQYEISPFVCRLREDTEKYDKQTGASFVFPSSRGFCSSHSILDHLFPINNEPSIPTSESADTTPTPATTVVPTPTERDGSFLRGPKEQAEIEFMQSLHMKSTISALRRRKIHHQIQGN
ncbi:SPX domain-containing protein 2-like [Papaver somniferum]|uniref:SPX domain-containing protein 2-like n=1 Tax=Papaver somniferum TaxID=3469 RepID=UPI000E704AC8|nr:SPX domain-containing protein 2-like [Papaver somniferum]